MSPSADGPRAVEGAPGRDAPPGAAASRAAFERLSVTGLPWPTDWAAHFGARAPLDLEIGFGRGDFLLDHAARHPERQVVGVEISNRSLVAVERRLARGAAPNARVVHASAEAALAHLFAPGALSAVYVNFPDPWFKARHGGRRLMRRDVLDAIVSRLAPGGWFHLATDIRDYAELTAALLDATPGLEPAPGAPWADARRVGVATKYEARARAEGRPCHYFARRRNARPAPEVPIRGEAAMPHIAIEGPLDLAALQEAFRPADLAAGETHVGLLAAYRAPGALLVEAVVVEPTLSQRVALVLRRQSPARHVLGLGTIGRPRPTEGIHQAVALVGRWVADASPGARVAADGLVVDRAARRTFEAPPGGRPPDGPPPGDEAGGAAEAPRWAAQGAAPRPSAAPDEAPGGG